MVIAIAGGSGSGKTTYARKLLTVLGEERALILGQDAYYKDQSLEFSRSPSAVNFDDPRALDFSLMIEQLRELKRGQPVDCPRYDFSAHKRVGTLTVAPKPILIVEGILIFHPPELFAEFDLTYFMETAESVRLQRRIDRDLRERGRTEAAIREQFFSQVKPMHDRFVQPTKALSDYVIET